MTSREDAVHHIDKVRRRLAVVIHLLSKRGIAHDASKLQEPELSGYQGLSDALQGLTYGTPEHRAAFAPFKGIIAHHYAHNSHHPEHWLNGVDDMSLLDVIEMLADWKAASERGNGDFGESIRVSVGRFKIDPQLADILINTAKELGWIDV